METTLDNVVWQEGMLLRPQHFQQNDNHWHYQLYARARQLHRHQWGFSEITLNHQYLRMGKISLTHGAGIFPDGTLFDLSGSLENPVLDVPPGTTDQLVYFSLPVSGSQHQSMYKKDQSRAPRILSYEVSTYDQNALDKTAVDITCGRLNFHLKLQEEEHHGWIRLPVCHIQEVSGDGQIILSTDFHPTCLNIGASAFLSETIQMLTGMLEQRIKLLVPRLYSESAVSGSEVSDFIMLQSLNRAMPRLKHWASSDPVHPEIFFLELLTLLGELSTYSARHCLEEVPSYQHYNQKGCFTAVVEPLQQLLSQVLTQQVVELTLSEPQYDVYVAVVNERNLFATATLILAVKAEVGVDVLLNILPAKLKVSAVERINNLVNFNLSGVPVKPLAVAPRQLPFLTDHAYFSLDIYGEELRYLQDGSGLAIHDSSQIDSPEFKLWAIRGEDS